MKFVNGRVSGNCHLEALRHLPHLSSSEPYTLHIQYCDNVPSDGITLAAKKVYPPSLRLTSFVWGHLPWSKNLSKLQTWYFFQEQAPQILVYLLGQCFHSSHPCCSFRFEEKQGWVGGTWLNTAYYVVPMQ